MKKTLTIILSVLLLLSPSYAQKKKASAAVQKENSTYADAMAPTYKIPYGIPQEADVKADMDRILHFLEGCTPAAIVDKNTGSAIGDFSQIGKDSQLERGSFELSCYEWGVVYSAMLDAAAITGDKAYSDYAMERLSLLAEAAPYFAESYFRNGCVDHLMRQVIEPKALDDCGAICAAMIKAKCAGLDKSGTEAFQSQIERYFKYLFYEQFRRKDGILARTRPMKSSVWLDDMYMGIPAIAHYGYLTRFDKEKYFSDALRQIQLYKDYMWVPQKQLFRHAWVEDMDPQPTFHWARANAWAMLALSDVLDVYPKDWEGREEILKLFRQHVEGVVSYQGGDGFWHQLIDRNDSYTETSATAIFTYCIAHGINKGWLNALSYGPTALLGWNAVKTRITAEGKVEGTCVGTGMGFDPAFYYARPASAYAAHGYGPAIMAGAEIIGLLREQNIHITSSGVVFYRKGDKVEPNSMFGADSRKWAFSVSGKRNGNNPILFLVGDSTMIPDYGWGEEGIKLFDEERITVLNCGRGGETTRSEINSGRWERIVNELRPGDFVLIDLGQNDDCSSLNTGKAKGTLPGNGDEGQKVVIAKDGREETVYSYGHYMRLMGAQAKAKGAHVLFVSYTAWNIWEDGKLNYERGKQFADWTKEAAGQIGVYYLDLFQYEYDYYSALGFDKTQPYFRDDSHLAQPGAEFTARHFAEQLREYKECPLGAYLK